MDIDEAAAREFAQSLDRAVCHLYLLKTDLRWAAEVHLWMVPKGILTSG